MDECMRQGGSWSGRQAGHEGRSMKGKKEAWNGWEQRHRSEKRTTTRRTEQDILERENQRSLLLVHPRLEATLVESLAEGANAAARAAPCYETCAALLLLVGRLADSYSFLFHDQQRHGSGMTSVSSGFVCC